MVCHLQSTLTLTKVRDTKQFTVNADAGEEGYRTITTVIAVGAARTAALSGADCVPGPVPGAAHTLCSFMLHKSFMRKAVALFLQRRNVVRTKFYLLIHTEISGKFLEEQVLKFQ